MRDTILGTDHGDWSYTYVLAEAERPSQPRLGTSWEADQTRWVDLETVADPAPAPGAAGGLAAAARDAGGPGRQVGVSSGEPHWSVGSDPAGLFSAFLDFYRAKAVEKVLGAAVRGAAVQPRPVRLDPAAAAAPPRAHGAALVRVGVPRRAGGRAAG